MGSLRLIFLIITRSVLPFGRTVGLLGRQPSDIDRPLRGLIIGFSNVILKEFGLCRSRGADPAVWIFRYETETKGDGCDQHHEANGTVKKNSAPWKKEKTRGTHTRAAELAARKERIEAMWKSGSVWLTVIFTIPPNAQASGLDGGKTKSNGFTQSGGIDVGYSVLVANPPVREIEPLPWDIAIGIWSIVRSEPASSKTKVGVSRGRH